jgi:uncharacterized membrane protein YhhN
MDSLLSDLISNNAQMFLAEGVKRYITLARLLRKIGTSIFVLQLFFMGIQMGFALILVPIFLTDVDTTLRVAVCLFGGVIVVACCAALWLWNSERAWSRRLHLHSLIKYVKDPLDDLE